MSGAGEVSLDNKTRIFLTNVKRQNNSPVICVAAEQLLIRNKFTASDNSLYYSGQD